MRYAWALAIMLATALQTVASCELFTRHANAPRTLARSASIPTLARTVPPPPGWPQELFLPSDAKITESGADARGIYLTYVSKTTFLQDLNDLAASLNMEPCGFDLSPEGGEINFVARDHTSFLFADGYEQRSLTYRDQSYYSRNPGLLQSNMTLITQRRYTDIDQLPPGFPTSIIDRFPSGRIIQASYVWAEIYPEPVILNPQTDDLVPVILIQEFASLASANDAFSFYEKTLADHGFTLKESKDVVSPIADGIMNRGRKYVKGQMLPGTPMYRAEIIVRSVREDCIHVGVGYGDYSFNEAGLHLLGRID